MESFLEVDQTNVDAPLAETTLFGIFIDTIMCCWEVGRR